MSASKARSALFFLFCESLIFSLIRSTLETTAWRTASSPASKKTPTRSVRSHLVMFYDIEFCMKYEISILFLLICKIFLCLKYPLAVHFKHFLKLKIISTSVQYLLSLFLSTFQNYLNFY